MRKKKEEHPNYREQEALDREGEGDFPALPIIRATDQ